jgi:hypothetical protein
MNPLNKFRIKSGQLIPVFRLEIHTRPDDAGRLLDAVMEVCPLRIGQYERNATVTGIGAETGRPGKDTVTRIHNEDFEANGTEVYPAVELKFSIERDIELLERIMGAVLYAHQYEEPTIYVREEWGSRSAYNPDNNNPNRWWNDGRGTPEMVDF